MEMESGLKVYFIENSKVSLADFLESTQKLNGGFVKGETVKDERNVHANLIRAKMDWIHVGNFSVQSNFTATCVRKETSCGGGAGNRYEVSQRTRFASWKALYREGGS